MANENIAIVSVKAMFDEKSVRKVAQDINRSVSEVNDNLDHIEIAPDLKNQLDNILKIINKKFKNVNLSKFSEDLLKGFLDPKETTNAINEFIRKIEALNQISLKRPANIFDNLDTKQLDKLINDYDRLEKARENINKKEADALQKAGEVQGRIYRTMRKDYKDLDTFKSASNKERLDDIKKEIDANKELNKTQESSLKEYSELLSLYSIISSEKYDKGSIESIKQKKELLDLTKRILESEEKISKFSKNPNAYRISLSEDNTEFKSFDIGNAERLIHQVTSQYAESAKKTARAAIDKIQNEINTYIEDALNKNVNKIKNVTDKVVNKLNGKNSGDSDTGDTYDSESSGSGNGNIDDIVDNVVSEKDIVLIEKYNLSLDDLAAKLYDIVDRSDDLDGTELPTDELKDFIGYYKQYAELIKNEPNGKIEDELSYFYNDIINKPSLKKFADQLDEIKSKLSNQNIPDVGKELSEEFSVAKEDVDSLIQSIKELIEEIKKLTQTKGAENLLSGENVEELSNKFNEIASNFGEDLVNSVNDFKETLTQVDNEKIEFNNIKESLMNIVEQFKNSLSTVGLTSTQLDKAYETIKGWNDASTVGVKYGTEKTDRERATFINSKTGNTSNSFFIDAEEEFSRNLLKALAELSKGISGQIGEVYDTWVHSHPIQKMIEGIRTQGSDVGFSIADLNVMLKNFIEQGVKKMLVTNNYKYTQLDLTDVSKDKFKEIIELFKEELKNAGIVIENNNEKIPLNLIAENVNGKKTVNLDTKSSIINNALQNAIDKALKDSNIDTSKILSNGNIDDLKIDLNELDSDSEKSKDSFTELLNVLKTISDVLTEINNNGFKFNETISSESDLSKLQSELDETKNKLEEVSKEALETKKKLKDIDPTNQNNKPNVNGNANNINLPDNEEVRVELNTDVQGFMNRVQEIVNMHPIDVKVNPIVDENTSIKINANIKVGNSDNTNSDIQPKQQKKIQDNSYKKVQEQSKRKQEEKNELRESKKNSLLEKQYNIYKEIYDINIMISKLDPDKDTDEINKLKEKKKLAQQNYLVYEKELKQYSDIIDQKKRSIELYKIASKANKEITQNNKKQKSKHDTKNAETNFQIQQRLNVLLEEQESNLREIQKLERKGENNRSEADNQKLNSLYEQRENIETRVNAALKEENANTQAIVKTRSKLQDNLGNEGLNNFGRVIDLDKAYDDASKINEELNKFRSLEGLSKTDAFSTLFKNAESDLSKLNQEFNDGRISVTGYVNEINKINSDLLSNKNALKIIDEDTLKDSNSLEATMNNLAQSIFNADGKSLKFNKDTNKLTGEFKTQKGEIQKLTLYVNKAGNAINYSFSGQPKENVNSMTKAFDLLGKKFRDLGAYLTSFVGFYEIWGAIKQGVGYVKDFDSALTEMRKVSDETVTSLREYQKASFDVADSVGATALEIQSSTADWQRLGYAIDEANELSKLTNIYKNVGDNMNIEDATSSMVSTLEGFQLEAEKAKDIVDIFNEVSNSYAIDSKGIGDALQRSAASFNAANTGLEESVALITATMNKKWLCVWKHIQRIHLIAGKSLEPYTTI